MKHHRVASKVYGNVLKYTIMLRKVYDHSTESIRSAKVNDT